MKGVARYFKLTNGSEEYYMTTSQLAKRYKKRPRTISYYQDTGKEFDDGFHIILVSSEERKKAKQMVKEKKKKMEETRIEMIARILNLYGNMGIRDKEKNLDEIIAELKDMGISVEPRYTKDEYGKEHISLWKI